MKLITFLKNLDFLPQFTRQNKFVLNMLDLVIKLDRPKSFVFLLFVDVGVFRCFVRNLEGFEV
jgi:hypothetical protein